VFDPPAFNQWTPVMEEIARELADAFPADGTPVTSQG